MSPRDEEHGAVAVAPTVMLRDLHQLNRLLANAPLRTFPDTAKDMSLRQL